MSMHAKCTILLVLSSAMVYGCGPSKEERKVIEALNKTKELADREAYVLDVDLDTDSDDAVFRFEAEVLDKDGDPIGKISGRRVENFGTVIAHRAWYDEVDPEEVKDMRAWERKEREKRRERWRQRRAERARKGEDGPGPQPGGEERPRPPFSGRRR